jgi:hypothetical protein
VQQIANEEEGRTNHPFWLMIVAIRKAYGGRDNICGAQVSFSSRHLTAR